ncbi:uncharacterized protein F5147DRAFT_658160 [Suillus discolor]|uniref:Uncharacterized protein n=1 Tax=Suillus discolor TaxID=1912936 RepID=A0A9P7JMR6_9AGAM|nr:uncharacterized protein F5147DRAFT_658160 [Suillus discolor]KAG2090497.1 hypothetical protein F5147DRAFT_658160 [Suillus discolor]
MIIMEAWEGLYFILHMLLFCAAEICGHSNPVMQKIITLSDWSTVNMDDLYITGHLQFIKTVRYQCMDHSALAPMPASTVSASQLLVIAARLPTVMVLVEVMGVLDSHLKIERENIVEELLKDLNGMLKWCIEILGEGRNKEKDKQRARTYVKLRILRNMIEEKQNESEGRENEKTSKQCGVKTQVSTLHHRPREFLRGKLVDVKFLAQAFKPIYNTLKAYIQDHIYMDIELSKR